MSNDKLVIFGNGLGMSIDHEHFNLETAMHHVWQDGVIDQKFKKIIAACTGLQINLGPRNEDDLRGVYKALEAINTINNCGQSKKFLLTSEAKEFPEAITEYSYKVAAQLYNSPHELPDDFATPLSDFILRTKSHVATLNYDRLLYSALFEKGVLRDRYETTSLCDGMRGENGFDRSYLERYRKNNFGYYLHLHGSPLYVDKEDKIIKLQVRGDNGIERLPIEQEGRPQIGSHIVLSSVEHKTQRIGASGILSAYWDYLDMCIAEAEEIILFGYSGCDTHLNDRLKSGRAPWIKYTSPQRLTVIEWIEAGAGETETRSDYWAKLIKKPDILISKTNICDFVNWDNPNEDRDACSQ